MKLVLSPKAKKQLKKLPVIDQIVVGKKIRLLKNRPVVGEEKLSGVKGYRVRVGDLRIVYVRKKSLIYIVLIGHRKDVYKLLRQLL